VVGMMGWMSVWMVIGFLIFLALVAGAVYLVVQLTRRDPDDLASGQEILERRLASGEINPEEYARRQSTMRGEPPPPGAN
jgi:uncharacterized membrane protein